MDNKLPAKHSDALRIATILATFLVVLRHSFNLHHFYVNGYPWMSISDWNIYLQRLGVEITNVAIPSFFLMSGFLFFRDVRDWHDCLVKWRHRCRSLLLPYLLWNVLFLILVLLLSKVPELRPQLQHTYGVNCTWYWLMDKLTLHPIMGHFWYIRTLMFFMLLAPLIYYLLQNSALSYVALCILVRIWHPIDTGVFSTEGTLFFFIGSWMACHGGLPDARPSCHWMWLLLPICYAFLIQPVCPSLPYLPGGVFIFMYVCWQICLIIVDSPNWSGKILALKKHMFFVYALHATLVSGMSLLVSRQIPHSPLNSFLCYVGTFLVTVTICLLISIETKRLFPKLHSFFSGWR